MQGSDFRPDGLTVLLCHGFGAPGDDLVPLAEALWEVAPKLKGSARFIFPEAPLALPMFGGGARAWWEIQMARWLELQGLGEAGREQLRQLEPPGMAQARKALLGAVEALAPTTPASRLVLGGFSQGAMLTTDVALRLEEKPAGLVVLSGSLVCEPEWTRRLQARQGLRVFQSHGLHDEVLHYASADALRERFERSGQHVEFVSFSGGHGIPAEVLSRLGRFLEALR